ncbi:MAG: Ig-like domain-containing protein, partial [Desulfotomaculaceae bacterium]|nr:Ig-like domain-containing protein [Desulfotomaculaceae bacterium]
MNIRFKTWKITVSLLVFCFFTWGCLFFFENDLYAASGGLVVVSTDPANGETNVPVNKTITLAFDKEIYPGDNIGEIALIKGNDWLEVSAGPVQNQLVIKPVSELASGAMYYLYLPPGSVKGLETEFVLDFQTVSAVGDKLAVNQSTNIMKKNTALQANALSSAESGALINPVDVVFAIDNTGSMGGTIDTVKRDVKSIVDQIRTVAPDSRFGAIKFMDYGSTSDYVTEIACQPTDQIDVLKSAVNTMY